MTKNLKIVLIALFVIQVVVAFSFELAHDEAYYWLYSKNLDWGYFDHPPMVALVVRLFSFLPHSELSVRLGFIFLQFLTLCCIFRMVPAEKRLDSLLLYFAFPLASFAGLLALPDMPLLFMTGVYCLLLKSLLEEPQKYTAPLLGLTISLLLMSKYHGILLIVFTLLAIPRLLKTRVFYLITAIALVGCLPHFIWQYRTGFLTLKYHFLERPTSSFSFNRVFEYLGAQIGLAGVFAGPFVWWFCAKRKSLSEFERALKLISLGTLVFFLFSTLSKKVEANWTVFLTVPLIVLISRTTFWGKKLIRLSVYLSFSIVIISRSLFLFPSSIPAPKRLKEFKGWEKWSMEVQALCRKPILANTYQIASKLSFYLKKPIHSQNFRSRKNQFDLWNKDPEYYQGDEVCYLSDNREYGGTEVQTPEGKVLYMALIDLSALK